MYQAPDNLTKRGPRMPEPVQHNVEEQASKKSATENNHDATPPETVADKKKNEQGEDITSEQKPKKSKGGRPRKTSSNEELDAEAIRNRQLNIRISDSEHRRLKMYCTAESINLGNFCHDAIMKALETAERKQG